MKSAPIADVKAKLNAYIRDCRGHGPIVITRSGKAVAFMAAVHDDEDLERLKIANSPRMQAIFAQARKRLRAGKGLSHEAFWKAVDKGYGKDK